jgi:hypothetical protein
VETDSDYKRRTDDSEGVVLHREDYSMRVSDEVPVRPPRHYNVADPDGVIPPYSDFIHSGINSFHH